VSISHARIQPDGFMQDGGSGAPVLLGDEDDAQLHMRFGVLRL